MDSHYEKPPILFIVLFAYLLFLDDHSRVILEQTNGDPKSDYINASYIPVRIPIYPSPSKSLPSSKI